MILALGLNEAVEFFLEAFVQCVFYLERGVKGKTPSFSFPS